MKAGVDTSVFKAYSCRLASSSKARDAGTSVSEILKKGGWKSVNIYFQNILLQGYNKFRGCRRWF